MTLESDPRLGLPAFAASDPRRDNKLFGFTISHFAEKARWALDYKAVPYRWIALLPGPHLRTVRRMAPKTTVPVLRDGETVVQGSSEILDYVEARHPESSLTPTSEEERQEARDLEDRFDRVIGEATRRIFYSHALPHRRLTVRLFTQGGPAWGPALYSVAYPFIARAIGNLYKPTPENVAKDDRRLTKVFAEIEERLQDRRYLVSDRFSRADFTLAALLGPLWTPAEHPIDWPPDKLYPPPLLEWQQRHAQSALCEYVLRMYRDHRVPTA